MASFIEGTHEFKVRTKNRAGVWGEPTTFTVKIDLTAPVIEGMSIVSTGVDARIKADHTSFQVTLTTITDALSGVAKTRFFWSYNGTIWNLDKEYNGVQLSHTFTKVDLHSNVIFTKVEAEDVAGNISEMIRQRAVEYVGPFDYSMHVDKWSNLPKQDRGT